MKTVYKENSKNRCDITEKSAAVGTASGNYGTKTVKTKKKSKIMPKNHSDSAVLYGTVARKLMVKYKRDLSKRTILLSINGTVGNVALYHGEKCILGKSVVYLNIRDGIDPLFIYYVFCSREFREYLKNANGSTIKNVSLKMLNEYSFDLPEFDIQRKISCILSSIDRKIGINQFVNDNLEKQLHIIYQSYDKSEWNIVFADSVFHIGIGKTPPRKEIEWFSSPEDPVSMRWVSISDMGKSGIFIQKTAESLTKDAVKTFNIQIIPDNTILLSFKLTVGRVAITDGIMCTNEAIAHFKTEDPRLRELLYIQLKEYDFEELGNTSSIATAVNSKTIKKMMLQIPSEKILSEMHQKMEPLLDIIKKLQQQSMKLCEIRDIIMPKLMSGEIDVSSLVDSQLNYHLSID